MGTQIYVVPSTVMEYFFLVKEIFMRVTGRMTKCMDLENIDFMMAKCMLLNVLNSLLFLFLASLKG